MLVNCLFAVCCSPSWRRVLLVSLLPRERCFGVSLLIVRCLFRRPPSPLYETGGSLCGVLGHPCRRPPPPRGNGGAVPPGADGGGVLRRLPRIVRASGWWGASGLAPGSPPPAPAVPARCYGSRAWGAARGLALGGRRRRARRGVGGRRAAKGGGGARRLAPRQPHRLTASSLRCYNVSVAYCTGWSGAFVRFRICVVGRFYHRGPYCCAASDIHVLFAVRCCFRLPWSVVC